MPKLTPDEILAGWQRICEVTPAMGWEAGQVVQLIISGQEDGNWVCDLRKPPRVFRGRARSAAQVTCDAAALSDLDQGKFNLLELHRDGRIAGVGDRDTLTRFGLFLAVLSAVHPT